MRRDEIDRFPALSYTKSLTSRLPGRRLPRVIARRTVMDQAVILSAVRTPIGKFQGGFAPLSAPQLGAKVVAETVRHAGLGGGLDVRVAAMTINKVCGSGLKAVGLAAQSAILGEAEIVVAGGMESMS